MAVSSRWVAGVGGDPWHQGGGGVLMRSAASPTHQARRWCPLLDEGGGLSSVVVAADHVAGRLFYQVDKQQPTTGATATAGPGPPNICRRHPSPKVKHKGHQCGGRS